MKQLCIALALAASLHCADWFAADASAAEPAGKPNIVVILADDMGFSDLGCYGSEIPTPHLDALAKGGLRFTQFYNTGRCCPTRAALLTGLYSHQTGVGDMTGDDRVPGYRGFLNDRCVTIAELLREAGYFTAMAGKWHVGTARGQWPLDRGFNRFYGMPGGGGFYFRPSAGRDVVRDQEILFSAKQPPPEGWYSTDAWTDAAIGFVDEAAATKKPFFLYVAHNAPHFPLQVSQAEAAAWRGKYKVGWDNLRARRHARQLEFGLVDRSWPLSKRAAGVAAWDSLGADEQDRFDQIMSLYAAVVVHLDQSVGRLVESLKKQGLFENTLVLFLSDNGASWEGGPKGRLEGEQPGSAESTVYEGESWSTLSNTPFRGHKMFNHEGGIATPLIAHWPAGIREPGAIRHQPGHVIDIMATCLDLAGAAYPAEFEGRRLQALEGRSIVPAFDNRPVQREALYWEHEGNAAIREGDWKLVRKGRTGAWELYNFEGDRTEQQNLALRDPDRAARLAGLWEAWAVRCNVKPYPDRKKN